MHNRELIGSTLFLLLFVGYAIEAWQIPILPFEEYEAVTSATLPKVYAVFGILVCLLSLGAQAFKGSKSTAANTGGGTTVNTATIKQALALIVLMVIYATLLEVIGFLIATISFLGIGFFIMGERRKRILVIVSLLVAMVFWFIMTQLLGIYLTPGELWG